MDICSCTRLRWSAALFTLAVAAVVASPAFAQADDCNGFTGISGSGPNFGDVGSIYTITLDVFSGGISGGTQISVSALRYELGCETTPFNFLGCNMAGFGDPVLKWVNDSTIMTNDPDGGDGVACTMTWTSNKAPGDVGGQVVLTASAPIVMPPNSDGCEVSFQVQIDSLPSTDTTPQVIETVGGFTAAEAVCDNGLDSSNSQTLSIATCPASCDDGNVCTTDFCNTSTGQCVNEPGALDCNDNNVCTTDTCDPVQGCINTPGALNCDDNNVCTTDVCNPITGCVNTPGALNCDDNNVCTTDVCDPIQGCVNTPGALNCDDNNVCTTDICDPADGCVNTPGALDCSDTNPCTDDICDPILGCQNPCNPTGKPECSFTIGDFAWEDGNGDGLQDSETGIGGCSVELAQCDGTVVDSTSTDGAGFYEFTVSVNPLTCMLERDWKLNFVCAGLPGSPKDVGGNDNVDSDCDPETGMTDCLNFGPGGDPDHDYVDCGFVPPQGEAICRTPGFWGTHGGITNDLIAYAGGTITVCGNEITNGLDYGSIDDALEGLCVNVKGYPFRQLYRQLVAARLNCEVSAAGSCEGLIPYYGECDGLCAGEVGANGLTVNDCIEAIDCFNNGGEYDIVDGKCKHGNCSDDGSLCNDNEDCVGGDDGGGAGDCCVDNGSPGCDVPDCEAAICAADSFCCDVSWDQICADAAAEEPACGCGPACIDTGDGPCCADNGTPGCDINDCECLVCAIDPFCCDTSWDGICVDEAGDFPECGCGGDAGPLAASTDADGGTTDATPGVLVGFGDSGSGAGSTSVSEPTGEPSATCIPFESCHDRDLCPDPELLPDLCYEPVGQVDLPMTPKECNQANKSKCAITPEGGDTKAGGLKYCDGQN